jgi:hypothetical protein
MQSTRSLAPPSTAVVPRLLTAAAAGGERRRRQTIKERKGALAPQIKELRTVRQRFQDVEAEHTEKKKAYDAAVLQYSASYAKLETEVKELAASVLGDESKYHLTHVHSQVRHLPWSGKS